MESYGQLLSQIQSLTKQAEKVRKQEIADVVATIKRLIKEYRLSATDIGLSGGADSPKVKRPAKKSATKRKGAGVKVPPKYTDGKGNYWTGRGKKPLWIQSALESGLSLESLSIRS